jgi:hypothetical protein
MLNLRPKHLLSKLPRNLQGIFISFLVLSLSIYIYIYVFRSTRRVISEFHRSVLHTKRLPFSLAIPISSTPTFRTSAISLQWQLRLEVHNNPSSPNQVDDPLIILFLKNLVYDLVQHKTRDTRISAVRLPFRAERCGRTRRSRSLRLSDTSPNRADQNGAQGGRQVVYNHLNQLYK